MEESEFKKTCREVNGAPCLFAKAILRRCCSCSRSQKLFIAEREAVSCLSPGGRQRCAEVLAVLRDKAAFALKQSHIEGPLPHARELKVQCGGMLGLRASLTHQVADVVPDIHQLLEQSFAQYGSAETLPYTEVVRAISTFQPRHKR
ncbi:MAG: hypothetical protein OQL08_06785 [Gammaproteobacteria bacterium]|nr:hypothetical protein [Gammaproteobacteria bacterium]